ncbi:hypothetical protein GCK32_019965 [Trichostrongylus colubriformis]|uniref:Uncharacterized protein n=1 Tax=Trichostrongylus colubriformis TaxID=6319 RepID=A0AAN8EXI4_TRICO
MHISTERKAELLQKLDEFLERNKDKVTDVDAEVFRRLYRQLLEETPHIDWNSWKFISDDVQRNYEDLPAFNPSRRDILDRLVVVKLNGGLVISQ